MAFGTGSEFLFIAGHDFMIVWLTGALSENREGFSSTAADDFVPVIATGTRTDVICKDPGLLDYKYYYLECSVNQQSCGGVCVRPDCL